MKITHLLLFALAALFALALAPCAHAGRRQPSEYDGMTAAQVEARAIARAAIIRRAGWTRMPPDPAKFSPLYFMRQAVTKKEKAQGAAAVSADWFRYYSLLLNAQPKK